jgi:helix-turn-helix protein
VADPSSPFLDALLPVPSQKLAAHANAVTCVLAGRTGPLRLEGNGQRVDGDILLVRPGVVHAVALAERGGDVLYLNGLAFPFDAPLAQVLGGALAYLASDALRGDRCAMHELRARLTARAPRLPTGIAEVVRAIYADPMQRMSQGELGCFKAATGQTFRELKRWSALQHAAQLMAEGALVRTAAMDAGFADTAHLSRVFRRGFGLTPSVAIAGLGL